MGETLSLVPVYPNYSSNTFFVRLFGWLVVDEEEEEEEEEEEGCGILRSLSSPAHIHNS